ncbi:MAG: FAD-dependent oxidoreductase, partial [Acidobacteriota bacterium]|nr:FAD-dependent oxidoreductase [Acidobacteriota bacterium]
DFKIEKWIVERRVQQLVAEGVELRLGVDVGRDVGVEELRERHDAIVLATGSRVPRDLPVPGRELAGVHFAMEYLYVRNRFVARELGSGAHPPVGGNPAGGNPADASEPGPISAAGKHVVVIGGGDTGADCVGNAAREGAASIVQLELLPQPPARRPDDRTPWPLWPVKMRLSYAMDEVQHAGLGEQEFSVASTSFIAGRDGAVAGLQIAQAKAEPPFAPQPGSERELKAELVLLAMGFLGPEQDLLERLGVDRDGRSNIETGTPYETSVPGIFAAGDARRGQSLIVWAINEGRQCARVVDRHLQRLREDGAGEGPGAPEDAALAGHADADLGPEGPPLHVGPGVGAR